jgi:hypothetical protein
VSRHGPRPSSPAPCLRMELASRHGAELAFAPCYGSGNELKRLSAMAAAAGHGGGQPAAKWEELEREREGGAGGVEARTSPPVPAALLRLLCVHAWFNAAIDLSSIAMADAPASCSMNCPVHLHGTWTDEFAHDNMSSGRGRKRMTTWRK